MYRLFLCSDYVFSIHDVNFMLNFITSALSVVMFTVLSDVISQLHLYFLRKNPFISIRITQDIQSYGPTYVIQQRMFVGSFRLVGPLVPNISLVTV